MEQKRTTSTTKFNTTSTTNKGWIQANFTGTIIESALIHPLETMRLRFINHTPIYRNFASLYAGLHVRLLGTLPMRIAFWETHRSLQNTAHHPIASWVVPGIVQSLIDAPLNHLKTNQAEYGRLNLRVKGTLALTLRNTSFSTIYFPLLSLLHPHIGHFAGSFAAASLAAAPSQPFEIIRVQKQSIHSSTPYIQIAREITNQWRNPLNLWRGLHHRTTIASLALGINYHISNYAQNTYFQKKDIQPGNSSRV